MITPATRPPNIAAATTTMASTNATFGAPIQVRMGTRSPATITTVTAPVAAKILEESGGTTGGCRWVEWRRWSRDMDRGSRLVAG